MRGKGSIVHHQTAAHGITPAYAGKSIWLPSCPVRRWDHPRVCGEKKQNSGSPSGSLGSPPRMRGKGRATRSATPSTRITPAYAGKSGISFRQHGLTQDHPRVCGEKGKYAPGEACSVGSPPRMRGKAQRCRCLWSRGRITPAYAGKRLNTSSVPALYRDHPRVCGEKGATERRQRRGPGSPPRMRGKDELAGTFGNLMRITPAYAGKRWAHYWPGLLR